MVSTNMHIKKEKVEIKVILDMAVPTGGTMNYIEISSGFNGVTIFAKKEQLQEIADKINDALKEKEEVC